jgi:hypothetical protein
MLALGCTEPLEPQAPARSMATRGPVEPEGVGPLGESVQRAAACPARIPGARVTLVPIENGEALVFTDATEPSDALRRAVLTFAIEYDWGGSLVPSARGRHRLAVTFPTQVAYADTADGARLEIEALDPARVDDLERHLRQRVALMNSTHTCGSR